MRTKAHFLIVLSLLLCGAAAAQKIATIDEIKSDVEAVNCNNSQRLQAVENLFKTVGATKDDMTVVEKGSVKNLIVTKKGATSDTIVVGAHYDKVEAGCGAIDNWTDLVAIAHLYGTLRGVDMNKTFKFIAFDKEEAGLFGCQEFVKEIPKEQRSSYCSMVNLDSFGFVQPNVFAEASNEKMMAFAKSLWSEMKLQLVQFHEQQADADSTSFNHAGIPAITFDGLDSTWRDYLHSSKDQVKAIKPESVYMAYRTILPFLARIDKEQCDVFRKR